MPSSAPHCNPLDNMRSQWKTFGTPLRPMEYIRWWQACFHEPPSLPHRTGWPESEFILNADGVAVESLTLPSLCQETPKTSWVACADHSNWSGTLVAELVGTPGASLEAVAEHYLGKLLASMFQKSLSPDYSVGSHQAQAPSHCCLTWKRGRESFCNCFMAKLYG